MHKLSRLVYRLYKRLNDNMVMAIIFAISAAIHIIFSLGMSLPSVDPNEFGVLANTAFFTGKDWSSLTSLIGYYGYFQGLLYAPFMIFTDDAFVQYKAMVIFNGLLVSLVPVIAYKISLRFGIRRPWQSLTIAFCCGMYPTYLAHSKFVWNETICIVMVWVVALLIFSGADIKNKIGKSFYTILVALSLAVMYASHQRMFAVVIAALLCLVGARLFFKKKLVNFIIFIPSLIAFFLFERLVTGAIQQSLWLAEGGTVLNNTSTFALEGISQTLSPENIGAFFSTLFGHLYYFMTSTWGIGGLAFSLFIITICSYVYRKFKHMEQKYSRDFIALEIFAFFSVAISLVSSVFYKMETDPALTSQDTIIFGRYMDYVVPFAVLSVLVFLFTYGLDFVKILSSVITLGTTYGLFFAFSEDAMIAAVTTHISPVLALYPIRIGENISELLTHNTMLLTVSCALSAMALMIVVTCCSRKSRTHIIAMSMLVMVFYSSIYTAITYLPLCSEEAEAKNAPTVELSEYIYNKDDAPIVTAYSTTRHTATLLQFLNQNTLIIYKARAIDIEENCFIVAPVNKSVRVTLTSESGAQIPMIKLAQTDDFALYAYGERAVAYAQSQGDAIGVEADDENPEQNGSDLPRTASQSQVILNG